MEELNAAQIRYPSDLECAVMSNLVYLSEEEQEGESLFSDEKLNNYFDVWKKNGWEIKETFHGKDGYFGTAYINKSLRQIVIAHRGTKPTVLGSLRADGEGVILNDVMTPQLMSAVIFTQTIIGKGNISNKLCDFQLTLTGHSLGGWLAEATAADLISKVGLVAHTVTFDCPGSGKMVKKILGDKSSELISKMDVLGYLSAPDLVNIQNPQICDRRRVFPAERQHSFMQDTLLYTPNQHYMSGLLNVFDINTGVPKRQEIITKWPGKSHLAGGGEYSAFHAFAIDSEIYRPDTGKSYERKYAIQNKAHYSTDQYFPHKLSLSHCHPAVRELLPLCLEVKTSLGQVIKDKVLFEQLRNFRINNNELTVSDNKSAIEFHNVVMHNLYKNPSLLDQLRQQRDFDARLSKQEAKKTTVQTMFSIVQSGGEVGSLQIGKVDHVKTIVQSGVDLKWLKEAEAIVDESSKSASYTIVESGASVKELSIPEVTHADRKYIK